MGLLNRNHFVHGILACLSGSQLLAAEGPLPAPAAALNAGVDAFEQGNLDEAQRQFEAAVTSAQEQGTPLPEGIYNQGMVDFKRKQFDEALTHFQEATRTENLELQQDAFFNTGTTLLHQFSQPEDTPEALKAAVEGMDRSRKALRQSMLLQPGVEDARQNYEFATARKKEFEKRLEELQQQQQQQQQQDSQEQEKEDQQKQDSQQEQNPDQKPEDSSSKQEPGSDSPQDNPPEQQPQDGGQEPQPEDGSPQDSQDNQAGQPDSANEEGGQQQEAMKAGEELTQEEAEQWLQAMREQEAQNRQSVLMRMIQRNQAKEVPVEKDY